MSAQEELVYDKRLLDRNLRKGDLTFKEQAKFLKDLVDVSDKAAKLDENRLMREAHSAADRMRERLRTQPQTPRRPLPTPTTSFEDEEYADITPEGASE